MKEYKIKPLFTGNFLMDWGNILAPLCQGYFAQVPIFMFLIEGNGEQIIVDGSFDPATVPECIFHPQPRKPEDEIPAVLKRNGVDPLKIKTVIVSHLHHDHTGNLRLFKNARFILQEAELLESTYPVGSQAVGVAHKDWVDLVPKFVLINGDLNLREGIDLIFSPGHTPGHQAVMVNTSKGRAMLMGDSLYMLGGLSKRFPKLFLELIEKSASVKTEHSLDYSSPAVQAELLKISNARFGGYYGPCILNPGQNMQSLQKLDLMADMIVTSHDPLMHNMKVIPDDYNLFDQEVR
ncbi:MAG: N-acyl homoserine lactonase family protein [Syntrophales bacterium]|jgi:glyoxylase-like metal-dependent hydrolase (beta-lactamase superfamily II)